MERHWQSDDLSVSKIVLNEGDHLNGDCGQFGQNITLRLIQIDDLATLQQASTFDIDEERMIVRIGQGLTDLDFGLEKAAISMYPGEKSRFDVSATAGDKWITSHFEALRDEATSVDKLDLAQQFYDFGVSLLKQNKNKEAFKMLRQGATLASVLACRQEGQAKAAADLKWKCVSNLTLVRFNMGMYDQAVAGISYILEHCPNCSNAVKLTARRGRALIRVKDYEAAIADFEHVIEMDDNMPNIMADLNSAKKLLKEHERKLGSALKKMFI